MTQVIAVWGINSIVSHQQLLSCVLPIADYKLFTFPSVMAMSMWIYWNTLTLGERGVASEHCTQLQ